MVVVVGRGKVTLSPSDAQSKFERSCSSYDRIKWLQPLTIVTGVLGVGAIVYLVVTKPDPVAVVPVVSPDGAAVTARFDF